MTWFARKRQQWIYRHLRLCGNIRRDCLVEHFGISVPTASKDLQIFQQDHPALLRYDLTAKQYSLAAEAAPGLSEEDLAELAHEIAEEDSKSLIETSLLPGRDAAGEWYDLASLDAEEKEYVDRAVRYLDAAGILVRSPLNPNFVGWDEDDNTEEGA